DAKKIYNNDAIVSAGNIHLTAINIINNTNSLIYSMGDAFLKATDTILNKVKGNILSQKRIIMEAGTIHNHAGLIRSEGDMWLDADKILNESTYKGGDWDTGPYDTGKASYDESNTFWSKYHVVDIKIPNVSSDLTLDTRAEISSAKNLYINQDSTDASKAAGKVENRGGLIQAKEDIRIRGDLINSPKYGEISMLDYLNVGLKEKIVFTFMYNKGTWSNNGLNLVFSSVYQMLDFLYGNGVDDGRNYTEIDSDSRYKFHAATKKLAADHSLLNAYMNRLFGEQWKAADYSQLQQRWGEIKFVPGAVEGATERPLSSLERMKIYFLPAEKAAIVAGKDFIHTGGSFNSGIATELVGDVQKNQTVTVNVGDQEVNTAEQVYDVKFNPKNIAEISMGISSLPIIGALTEIKGLFEKSQAYIDYISALSRDGTTAQVATNGNIQVGPGGASRVIPLYETRPSMIDQSQYFGSDYFFNSVGYNSEKPVIVIGDNYFITELIRRQVNESIGTFYAQKYSVEGSDMVKMLFDNAGKVVASEEGASLVMGQALTQEQRENLTEDLVWFVTENIEGVDVLVPVIYLAQTTIAEIDTANKTGAAIVHAGKDVVVDAENIRNTNAVISAGNDVTLIADGDINNISSGMNAGIYAGGSANLVSSSGDITNSGSAISADRDINLIAENGNVDIIASVGRDQKGNQQISAYDDGITASGNINIQGKEVDITGVALTGGAGEDNVVRVAATEGNVNFNDLHEVKSSYSHEHQNNGMFTTRTEETTEASATSKTSSVNTGGKFVVEAAKDAVFTGSEYNASSGDISAEGDVTFKTSQDHSFKETKVTESSLVFGAKGDIPGLAAEEFNASTLTGNETSAVGYEAQGQEGNMSNSNTKRPGAAALADTASFQAGLQTTEVTTTESSTTNKNASFNFTNGVDIKAGKTLDIGGMDLAAGEDATANLSGNDIISTKYEDVHKSTVESKETFIGVKGEGHSSVLDMANKHVNRVEKNAEGMEIDGVMTALEVGGDISNVIMNDLAGGSVSAGWSETKESSSSESRAENINKLTGGTINFNSTKDTTLKGVDISADKVNVNTGGDFTLTAAESSTSDSSSTTNHNASMAWSGGAGFNGAGAGASIDYTGSTSSNEKNTTTYTNSTIKAG
ncbi:hemagglutinin repeat-containing protein, partial [Erwinia sp.]|uniref:hemagglutinin repeat-containing protein n=1 Tax=Erwinia citreus TaxID=558 RepID=UPI00289B8529